MATKSSKRTSAKARSAAKAPLERGKKMNGADILVSCLEREGVDTIFAYPGGCSMPIHQSLTRSKKNPHHSSAPRTGRKFLPRKVMRA